MDTALETARTLQRVDAVRNRAKLLDAARRQLADGDTALPLNAVARCAGVGVGTAYRHFPDRRSLVEGLAVDALTSLVEEARDAVVGTAPGEGLERLLRAALSAMAEDPVLAEVLATPAAVCVEAMGLSEELGGVISDLLSQARAAGAIRADVGPDDLRRLLSGVHSAAQAGAEPAAARERYLGVLLAGLRQRDPADR